MKDTPRSCAKCGKSTTKHPKLSMSRFPKPGSWNVLCVETWAKFIHPDLNWSSNDLHQKLYRSHKMLCEDHFEESAFIDLTSRKLRRYAIPHDVDHNPAKESTAAASSSTEHKDAEVQKLNTAEIQPSTSAYILIPHFNGDHKLMLSLADLVQQPMRYTHNPCFRMSKTALLIIAQGSEEMEAIITADMLRRGGITVTVAGLDGKQPVLCSRNITIVPDVSLADALAASPSYDAVILPGGLEGSERFSKSPVVGALLKQHEKTGKIIAAICAAPTAFVAHGVGVGKRVTSYPSTKEKITADYTYVEGQRVVVDGNVITSRGPGTAYWFGLSLIEQLVGKDKADAVEKGMIISGY